MTTRHHKGRGAVSDRDGRFTTRPVEYDPEEAHERSQSAPDTELRAMRTGRIIATNSSPRRALRQVDQSLPGLRAWLHLLLCAAEPQLSRPVARARFRNQDLLQAGCAAAKLAEEWEKPGYECEPITIGANTDPYQPAERQTRVTRDCSSCSSEHSHPVNLITKSNLVTRDIDLLSMSSRARRLCSVAISLPTLKTLAQAHHGATGAIGRGAIAGHHRARRRRRACQRPLRAGHPCDQ